MNVHLFSIGGFFNGGLGGLGRLRALARGYQGLAFPPVISPVGSPTALAIHWTISKKHHCALLAFVYSLGE